MLVDFTGFYVNPEESSVIHSNFSILYSGIESTSAKSCIELLCISD